MSTTRRMFLRGAGGIVVGLPLLERYAFGQSTSTYPKRFVVFMVPQGMIMNDWTPSGMGTNFTLSTILAPLEPYKSKLVVLSGIDNTVVGLNQLGNTHNSGSRTLLTCMPYVANLNPDGTIKPRGSQVENGNAAGPSIDQVLASRIGSTTPLRTLDLGIGGARVGENQILFAGSDDPVSLEGDPRTVFTRLFSNFTPPMGGGNPPPPPSTPIARIQAKRASVLDVVRRSFDQVQSQVSSTDRMRLEAHADKIRELEARIVPMTTPPPPPSSSCAVPTVQMPPGYDPQNFGQWDNYSSTAMIDELVMAMACDMTRVGTLQFTMYNRPTFPWLSLGIPGRWANWHAMVHEGQTTSDGRPIMLQVQAWYMSQLAYLLQQMSAVQEGDGTLLDNSLVLCVSEFGNGNVHSTNNLPIVLAGGLQGALQTGRHLNFDRRTLGDLYTTILNLFGGTDTSFGFPGHSTGVLPGV